MRVEQRGAPFATIYVRRLAVLFLFGFTAHARFGFNVLIGYTLALFVLGFLAVRFGVFHDPRRHTRLIVKAMIVALMVVYVGAVLLVVAWRPSVERYLTPLAWAGHSCGACRRRRRSCRG